MLQRELLLWLWLEDVEPGKPFYRIYFSRSEFKTSYRMTFPIALTVFIAWLFMIMSISYMQAGKKRESRIGAGSFCMSRIISGSSVQCEAGMPGTGASEQEALPRWLIGKWIHRHFLHFVLRDVRFPKTSNTIFLRFRLRTENFRSFPPRHGHLADIRLFGPSRSISLILIFPEFEVTSVASRGPSSNK